MDIEAQEVRDALTEGAQRLIAVQGYHGLKLEDVLREAGLSMDILEEAPGMKNKIIFRLGMNISEQLREDAQTDGDVVEMLDSYVTSSMRIMVGSSMELVQIWIEELVNENCRRGTEKMRWDWESIAGILRAGIAAGELREDTPVARLTGLLLAQYYGILFSWCVMQGVMNAVSSIHSYITETFPTFLAPYQVRQEAREI